MTLSFWWLICAMLVFLMQAGFLFLETGLVQQRHMSGIAIKNLLIFLISSAIYSTIGYELMWGESRLGGLVGWNTLSDPLTANPSWRFYQTGFAAVAATIISGTIAGRTTLTANFVCAALVSLFIYPIYGHWIWGGGFLTEGVSQVKNAVWVHDFAGSSVVHLLGGITAGVGAYLAGPRHWPEHEPQIRSQAWGRRSLPIAAVGVLFLWIGWIGFNGGSIKCKEDLPRVADYMLYTSWAASAGAGCVSLVAAIRHWCRQDLFCFSPYAILSGTMAGMVAITACCDLVYNLPGIYPIFASLAIGATGGFVTYFAALLLPIDDPVEAVAVHAGGGVVGLFASSALSDKIWWGQQFVGLLFALVWAGGLAWLLFAFLRKNDLLCYDDLTQDIGLTFEPTTEIVGLPPILPHYISHDLQEQVRHFLRIVVAAPIHRYKTTCKEVQSILDQLEHIEQDDELRIFGNLLRSFKERLERDSFLLPSMTQLTPERVAVVQIVRDVMAEYQRRYRDAIKLVVHEPPEPLYVKGNKHLVHEAIRQLVSNGIAAALLRCDDIPETDSFQPLVEARFEMDTSSQQRGLERYVHTKIRDNGLGVDSAFRKHLGRPFRTSKKEVGGTGLGLFFAAYIAQTFGGSLVHSSNARPDQGELTEFRISFPIFGESNVQ